MATRTIKAAKIISNKIKTPISGATIKPNASRNANVSWRVYFARYAPMENNSANPNRIHENHKEPSKVELGK
jgi:hypothetical protein